MEKQKRTIRSWWNNDGGPWVMLGLALLIGGLQRLARFPRQIIDKVTAKAAKHA